MKKPDYQGDSDLKTSQLRLFLFGFCGILTIVFLIATYTIYSKSYSDPRWRIFDYNSRQAAESEIYNVAEVPVVSKVKLVGDRTLRFVFSPKFATEHWKILSEKDRTTVSQGRYPEIAFTDEPSRDTYIFIPDDVTLTKEIQIEIAFYPKERYHEQDLTWPDNYYSPSSTIPFSTREPYSLDEWAGLFPKDPEVVSARQLMKGSVNMHAPIVERSEEVFRFVMESIEDAGGTPTDELQDASPMKTYEMLSTGTGKGWCENRALVYYLFANAAGIKTRLVDIAGKFGPLKLTGHYFCESWDPIQAKWYLVDPMSRAAHVADETGRLLHTLELKKLFDLDRFTTEKVLTYNHESKTLIENAHDGFYRGNKGYYTGDIVMAYKFGYPRNSNYSRMAHFLKYPTLLYAPFPLPRLYLVKLGCISGLLLSFVSTVVFGGAVISAKMK